MQAVKGRLKYKQKDFFILAQLAAKERAIDEIYFKKLPLKSVQPVADQVRFVMRAYRYSEDCLGKHKNYNKWDNDTTFNQGNCVEMPPWEWPKDGSMPENDEELAR